MNERKFSSNTENYVCQKNDLIMAHQSLGLNALKLIRAAIMQIKPEDERPLEYKISIKELANLLQVSSEDLYRKKNGIEDIIKVITSNPVIFREEQIRRGKLKIKDRRIPWITYLKYDSDEGILLQLNPNLMPMLIELKEQYTQYQLMDIMNMRSAYGIRLYEILRCMIRNDLSRPRDLTIRLSELRECLACEELHLEYKNFKKNVIEPAVKAINDNKVKTIHVTYCEIKDGRKVDAICFHITHAYDATLL